MLLKSAGDPCTCHYLLLYIFVCHIEPLGSDDKVDSDPDSGSGCVVHLCVTEELLVKSCTAIFFQKHVKENVKVKRYSD